MGPISSQLNSNAVFLFVGEGAHAAGADLSVLKSSPAWDEVDAFLREHYHLSAEVFLQRHLGEHNAPTSPVVTTTINVLQAALWRNWGNEPAFALGHSVGELGAMYATGLIGATAALLIATKLGAVAASLSGKMVHTVLAASALEQFPRGDLHLAAVNHAMGATDVSVTLCGPTPVIDEYLRNDQGATELRPKHPWHHGRYKTTEAFGQFVSESIAESEKEPKLARCGRFISATSARVHEAAPDAAHWGRWLSEPVQFWKALQVLVAAAGPTKLFVLQHGAHPVLDAAIDALAQRLPLTARVTSARRNEPAAKHLRAERAKLCASGLLKGALRARLLSSGALKFAMGSRDFAIELERSFAEQGITSAQNAVLANRLAPFFPGLAAHDLYRFSSVEALLSGWDTAETAAEKPSGLGANAQCNLGVLGWGLRLPADVRSADALWAALGRDDKAAAIVSPPAGFTGERGGYLVPPFSKEEAKAVARAAGVDAAEAGVLDPQASLALKLVDEMWAQVGPEVAAAAVADRERVGVYLGAWQQASADPGAKKSAFSAIGRSLSALAARVANVHNLQGPALTLNTACSSALVAVDAALKDARAGVIDYAIVGGVNLLTTSADAEETFAQLRRAAMLSPKARCHTFSAAADGYVRSEGGCVFLLRASSLEVPAGLAPPRALIRGSAVNQNSQRKPMTAVDPVAQERVVRRACASAGVSPAELAVVELHGTGTKLGDPVELSALAKVTAAADASGKCTLTAAKMHFGHLESAAGALGLLKSVLMLERRLVPAFEVDAPGLNPALQGIFAESRLALPAEGGTKLADDALLGVSSFGFAGNNAHVVLQAVSASEDIALRAAVSSHSPEAWAPVAAVVAAPAAVPAKSHIAAAAVRAPATSEVAAQRVWMACREILGDDSSSRSDLHSTLFDLGMDSLGFAELVITLEDHYGEGVITVDDIMATPTVAQIAAKIDEFSGTAKADAVCSPCDHEPISSAPTNAMAAWQEPVVPAAVKPPAAHCAPPASYSMPVPVSPPVMPPSVASLTTAGVPQRTPAAGEAAAQRVWMACREILGDDSNSRPDLHSTLFDLGMDSLGFAELVITLEDHYGEGVITVDDIMATPTVAQIAAKIDEFSGTAKADAVCSPCGYEPISSAPTKAVAAWQEPIVPAAVAPVAAQSIELASNYLPAPASPPLMPSPPVMPPSMAGLVTPEVLQRLSLIETGIVELRQIVMSSGGHIIPSTTPKGTPIRRSSAMPEGLPATTSVSEVPTERASPVLRSATAIRAESDRSPKVKTFNASPFNRRVLDAKVETPTPPAKQPYDDWIRTTHVGSLPRGTNLDPDIIIKQQLETGLSVINDGEWSRDNYIADMLSRISGLGSQNADGSPTDMGKWQCLCEMPCAADMRDVPTYSQRFTGGNGLITLNPKRVAKADVACTAVPTYVKDGPLRLMAKVQPFLDALAANGVSPANAFYGVPSPGTLAVFCEDRFYNGDHVAYVNALAEAMRPELEAIAATGLQLQVDCPDLAMGRHTRHANVSDDEFQQIAFANVAALNYALQSIPASQVRVHICWGNYAGPHHRDVAAKTMWPAVAEVHAKYFLLEAANPRHGHEVATFEDAVASGLFDESKVIVPGVIDTTAARVEHPALVAERLLRFVRAVGHPSRVIAASDCGFASTAKSVAITADLAWKKMEALVEGARLATRMLLEMQSPVPMATPWLKPTAFRAAIFASADASAAAGGAALQRELLSRASSSEVLQLGQGAHASAAVMKLRWAVDFPLALVAASGQDAAVAARTIELLRASSAVSRRPATLFVAEAAPLGGAIPGAIYLGANKPAAELAAAVAERMSSNTDFDKRVLVPGRNPKALPSSVDVVVVGGGLLGMVAAARLRKAGHSVVVLEQRSLVGGIWSMYANSTSQVNSSEGGYCLKEFLDEDSPRKHEHNRDHSSAAEVLADLAELGKSLKPVVHTQVQVVKVLGAKGDYTVAANELGKPGGGGVSLIQAKGVVLAINDRVGMPRPLKAASMDSFRGVMADGTSDQLRNVDWRGKRVAIFGMGAFAVENVRTALEGGAAHVTVVARRLGTICPKMIDYLNFVKPWDSEYRHETSTNVKQLKQWRSLYAQSGAKQPEVWPAKIKHDGHTISVSDIWFVASHMGKLATKVGTLAEMEPEGCVLQDGSRIPCDVVVGCIGFERNTTFCEQLTGHTTIKHSNYLDQNMMYLADAEIDESAFNSFFGSSVLEYAKFYTNVFVEAFERPAELGGMLWGADVPSSPVKDRKWTQYIAVGANLIKNDQVIKRMVAEQVSKRTEHFYRTMPPAGFVAVNKKEWEELHTRLNGGVPVAAEKQLPYFFGEAAEWCLPTEDIIGKQ